MKLTEIVQMKAIRCDNDCRELRRGRELEQRRKKEMANSGKFVDDTRANLVGRRMCQGPPRTVRCGTSRYLGFPRGRKELDSGHHFPPFPFLTAHPSITRLRWTGLDCARGERADHESSAGLPLDNSTHSLVALRGCDVSTCCTQRISKGNDAPRVTHRPLNQPDPVRICIEVPTIGSVVARAGRVQVGARWSFARRFVTRLRGLKSNRTYKSGLYHSFCTPPLVPPRFNHDETRARG
ncbi:hypothetical protein NA56DRAFT_140811 [Hyaloscypha hepaticicola]|uniref:Uncharacterized protein n=1 Tax=Hyaloscypha hepaticicola TaxID=2082293 RepID=A0A2J6QMV8_9HELO|nr:hypothetical protein NA56DRAFT_140811 [Hyaloscypha hepaticicola]